MNRPSLPFMGRLPGWLVKGVATLFGLGNLKPGPGTIGSLVGTVFFALVLQDLSSVVVFWVIIAMLIVGCFICDEAEIRIGKHDPGSVIFDEFAAMPIVFLGLTTPESLKVRLLQLLAGFVLFRIFDIAKPFGISRIQDLPGGLGIMIDDVAAALVSCALLHLGMRVILMFS